MPSGESVGWWVWLAPARGIKPGKAELTKKDQIQQSLHQFAQNPRKRRRGYRLVHKEGKALNHKRIWRLWREAGLCVPPRRRKKKLRTGKPTTALVAEQPDAVWCLDFLEDKSLGGQNLRILCVSDEFTRQALAIEVGTHFVSERVVAALQRLARQRATPGALRMDNGPEFLALALRGFCHRAGINPAYIDPGKPWQNGYAESFHSRRVFIPGFGTSFWMGSSFTG